MNIEQGLQNQIANDDASQRLQSSSTLSTSRRMFNSGPLALLVGCFTPTNLAESIAERLALSIQCGSASDVERVLQQKLPRPPNRITLTVKRHHLSPDFVTWTNHNQDPFLHFHQECSPVVWAIDNQRWQMLPVLARYGFDPNRPMSCRRWSNGHPASARVFAMPYQKFWTKGRYTYQSALDYYFGSIYEFLDEGMRSATNSRRGYSTPSSFYHFFQHLPQLLHCGVDVHRIDTIMLFNSLGQSLNWYLTRYTSASNTVPDIPQQRHSCAELYTVQALTRSGFSEFECLEFISSTHSVFGTLICLLCHPRLEAYPQYDLPPFIQECALLLINLLCLNSMRPTREEMRECLENQSLRKLYSKRYSERRKEFKAKLDQLTEACLGMANRQPKSLCLLARNAVRRKMGGSNFQARVRRLPNCPVDVAAFISYIDSDCLHMLQRRMPRSLLNLAKGVNPFIRRRSVGDDTEDSDAWESAV